MTENAEGAERRDARIFLYVVAVFVVLAIIDMVLR